MRYLDTGAAKASETLACWLAEQDARHIKRLRWQSGYFSADGLEPLLATIDHLSSNDMPIDAVIGSNELATKTAHVEELCQRMRMPRSRARLGIINFAGSLYHPKTYHLTRHDGSMAAYVGSANLGFQGWSGLNVEAGLILDSNQDDPHSVLTAIAEAVDAWFDEDRPGLELVQQGEDAKTLEQCGILAATQPPRIAHSAGGGSRIARPTRTPLFPFRRLQISRTSRDDYFEPIASPKEGFPPYVLFASDARQPMRDRQALSGASLPSGSTGIVIRLNKDSARFWYDKDGTANVSVPVPLVSTLRFGLYSRAASPERKRPRAEFSQTARFVSGSTTISTEPQIGGIMVYGHTVGDTGHGDVRLNIASALIKSLKRKVVAASLKPPKIGDVALLEWPTAEDPTVRFTFIDRRSDLSASCARLLSDAEMDGTIVGKAACWLPPLLSPPW